MSETPSNAVPKPLDVPRYSSLGRPVSKFRFALCATLAVGAGVVAMRHHLGDAQPADSIVPVKAKGDEQQNNEEVLQSLCLGNVTVSLQRIRDQFRSLVDDRQVEKADKLRRLGTCLDTVAHQLERLMLLPDSEAKKKLQDEALQLFFHIHEAIKKMQKEMPGGRVVPLQVA